MPEESPQYSDLSEILGVAGWGTPTDPFALPPINQVYLFNPKNRDFVLGNAKHPDTGVRRGWRFITIPGIIVYTLLLISAIVDPNPESSRWKSLITIFCIILVFFWSMSKILKVRQTLALAKKGKLIRGSLVKCTGQTIRTNTLSSFQVTATYQFTAPDTGQTLTATQKVIRKDLKEGKLPLANTTVAVLYVDEKHHRLM
jgi:hypothetical protein